MIEYMKILPDCAISDYPKRGIPFRIVSYIKSKYIFLRTA